MSELVSLDQWQWDRLMEAAQNIQGSLDMLVSQTAPEPPAEDLCPRCQHCVAMGQDPDDMQRDLNGARARAEIAERNLENQAACTMARLEENRRLKDRLTRYDAIEGEVPALPTDEPHLLGNYRALAVYADEIRTQLVAARAELAEAREDLDTAQAGWGDAVGEVHLLESSAHITSLNEARKQERARLAKWIRHDLICLRSEDGNDDEPCICGLDQAMEP